MFFIGLIWNKSRNLKFVSVLIYYITFLQKNICALYNNKIFVVTFLQIKKKKLLCKGKRITSGNYIIRYMTTQFSYVNKMDIAYICINITMSLCSKKHAHQSQNYFQIPILKLKVTWKSFTNQYICNKCKQFTANDFNF